LATANRWAPWIEPFIPATGGTVAINSTTPTTLGGASVTFVPHVNTRVAIPWQILAYATSNGSVGLVVQLLVNGVPNTQELQFFMPTLSEVEPGFKMVSVDLLALTSYELQLQAALGASGGAYAINATYTGIGPMIAMPNLHS
jgi:hypothetical protein